MRARLVALGAIALLGLALYWTADQALLYKGRADALEADLKAERAKTNALRENVAKASAKAQKAQRELDHALSEVPEWRDAAVPEPVVDSLCGTLRCAKPAPVRAP